MRSGRVLFRDAVVVAATTVLAGSLPAPLAAADPSAPPSAVEGAGGLLIQAVEDGVWKMVSDGAGHVLFGGDGSITFDGEGRAIICCAAGRDAGYEVEQIYRFGEPDAIASIGPSVPYPRPLHVDADGTLWLADLSFDGERWVPPGTRLHDADSYHYLPDGSVWAGFSSG